MPPDVKGLRASALLQSLDPVGSGRGCVDHELHARLVEDLEPVVIELKPAGTRMIEAAARGDEWGDVSCFPQLSEPRRRRAESLDEEIDVPVAMPVGTVGAELGHEASLFELVIGHQVVEVVVEEDQFKEVGGAA